MDVFNVILRNIRVYEVAMRKNNTLNAGALIKTKTNITYPKHLNS